MVATYSRPFSPSHKRSRFQRQQDLALISKLYLEGHTQVQIVEIIAKMRPYTLSAPTINKDIMKVWAEWRAEYVRNANEVKTKELARIDKIESELWEAWRRSMEKTEQIVSERIEDSGPEAYQSQEKKKPGRPPIYSSRSKVRRTEENRDGDMTFMQGIMWCVEQRAKILGLNAPEKHEINWRKEAENAGVDPDEVHNALVAQFMQAASKGYDSNSDDD